MSSAKIIFDSRESGQTVKQVASINGCIITLYENKTMIQHAADFQMPFLLPPDMLGIKPVSIEVTDSWNAIINMSDGSTLKLGLDCEWMRAHGYVCSEQGHWIVHPDGNLWYYDQTTRPFNYKWILQKDAPLKGVKKIVPLGEDMYGCAILMDDGRIMVRHNDVGGEMLQPTPWLEDEWVYKDVVAGRAFVHGINQHGQVILTHMDPKSSMTGVVMWPLPDSNAVSFPINKCYSTMYGPREIILEGGSTVFYTDKSDWKGKKTCHIAYQRIIAGRKGGAWLQHAGMMASILSPGGRIDGFIPPNLKSRNDVKAIRALGSV